MSGLLLQAEIQAALIEVGQEVGSGKPLRLTFERTFEENPEDPRAPWEGDNGSPDTYTLVAMEEPFKAFEINGTSVLAEDRRYMVEAGKERPTPGDRLADGRYHIHRVDGEAPGGVDLYYTIHLRK